MKRTATDLNKSGEVFALLPPLPPGDYMRISQNKLWIFRQELNNSIRTIPKKNREKFQFDLLTLISKAHEDDYENFQI